MKPEQKIEKYLIETVKRFGGQTRKLSWIGKNFAPDRIVLFPSIGVSFCIECKSVHGTLSEGQKEEMELLNRSGLRTYVAYIEQDILDIIQKELALASKRLS